MVQSVALFGWYSFHFVDFACMSATYPVLWSPMEVTSEADFQRWENSNIWQLTIVFSLGNIRSNLITFCYLDIIDRAHLRTTCFAFAVEVTDCYTDLAELRLQ